MSDHGAETLSEDAIIERLGGREGREKEERRVRSGRKGSRKETAVVLTSEDWIEFVRTFAEIDSDRTEDRF